MAYNQNIPQPTDALKVSQQDILDNFLQLYTFFGVNHQNFGEIDSGKHKFLQMPVQVADPATNATEVAFYSKIGADSGIPELCFRRDTNGTVIPFTEGVNATQGWSRLPSGLVMKWNSASLTAGQAVMNITHTLPLIGPVLSTSFWGIVYVNADFASPATDVNAIALVNGLASNQISYRLWQRNVPSIQPNKALSVYGLLLGVE